MRFLADESCDFRVVRALRQAGHDVSAVIEIMPGAEDSAVIDLAARDQRTLITEDRDFGQLVYAAFSPTNGVILLRFPSHARNGLTKMLIELFARHETQIAGRFVVVQPGRVRISGTPER